jgi:hypothetical protein
MVLSSRILMKSIARGSRSRLACRQRRSTIFRWMRRLPSHPALVDQVEQQLKIISFLTSDSHQRLMMPSQQEGALRMLLIWL